MIPRPKSLAVGTIGALATLVFIPSSATASYPIGSFYPIIGALAFMVPALLISRSRVRRPPFVAPLIAFYLLVTSTTLLAGGANAFSLLLPAVVLPIYWAAFSATASERAAISRAIIVMAIMQCVLAFGEVALQTGVLIGAPFTTSPENAFMEGLPRAQGTLAHPIVLGFVLLVAMGLLCAIRPRPVLRTILIGWFAATTVLTGSSWSVLVAIVIIAGWFLYRPTWAGRTFAVIAAACGALLLASTGLVGAIIEQELDPRNAGHRLNSISAIPNLIFDRNLADSIFGQGYGSVQELYMSGILVNDGFYAIDNQFVTFLVQGGIVGCGLILAAIIGITLRVTAQASRRYLVGWIGLLAMGISFDFMVWYAAAATFLTYTALTQPSLELSNIAEEPGIRQRRRTSATGLMTQ